MNANQLVSKLIAAELNPRLEPDTKRMIRNERMHLQVALNETNRGMKSGEFVAYKAESIKHHMDESIRVAAMWGVKL